MPRTLMSAFGGGVTLLIDEEVWEYKQVLKKLRVLRSKFQSI